jgi:Leucine-rich repeat (LRR) protein
MSTELPAPPTQTQKTLAVALSQARAGAPAELSGFVSRALLVLRLASELRVAHAAGRIHGGICPDHVHIDGWGTARLIGWGSSSEVASQPAAYRAPELLAGGAATVGGDIYSLGAVLWELLTLRPPLVVEDNLTRYWRRKRAGEVDALPNELASTVPPDLLGAARRALAADPELRWQDAEEMQTALAGWLDRVESVVVTMQAESELAAAPGGTGDVGHAAAAFRSALALWPDNQTALEGLSAAACSQALDAVEREDEDAATQYAGQTLGAAEVVVTAHIRRLHRRKAVRRWLALVTLVVIVLGAGFCGWLWWSHQRIAAEWRTEAEWRLGKGARTVGLEATARNVDDATQLAPPTEDGLSLPTGRIVWLKDVDARGDVRIGVEAEWTQEVDGMELMLGVPRSPPPAYFMAQPGYTCQFGGYRGTQTFLSSSPVAGWPRRQSPVFVPFEAARRYRLELERHGEMLRMRVDGRQVWEQRELIPLGDSRYRWLGLRAWSQVRLHRIYVEKPVLKPGAGDLGTADALARSGHHADALALYLDVLSTDPGPEVFAQALAKAHQLTARLPGQEPQRKLLFRQAERGIPDTSPYLRDVLNAEALALWQAREWTPAINLAERIQRRYPDAACGLALLERRLSGVPDASLAVLLRLVAEGPPVSHLNLSGLGLADISALSGMRIESLDIANNRITDLGPLTGLRLQILTCSGNRIADISALRGMPLLRLEARANAIADLSPLAGTRLEHADLSSNRIVDLSPIASPSLRRLAVADNPVSDLRPLSACVQLQFLDLNRTRVADLSALPCEVLVRLDLADCPLSDVSPLAASRVSSLDLSRTAVTDLRDLPRGMIRLLNLSGTQLADLSSLRGMNLGLLNLSDTPITSLAGLEGVALHSGSILILDRTAISSLEPISGRSLTRLSICGTRVFDLSPLADCTLGSLQADGVPATDVSPIARVSGLRRLSLWSVGAGAADLDSLADILEQDHRDQLMVETIRVQAAARACDGRRLRAMARRYGARDRLIIGAELTILEARAAAAAAGAHLPCPDDVNDLRDLSAHKAVESWFWLGLQGGDAGNPLTSDTGRPADHLSWLRQPVDGSGSVRAWVAPTSPAETGLRPVTDDRVAEQRFGVILEW